MKIVIQEIFLTSFTAFKKIRLFSFVGIAIKGLDTVKLFTQDELKVALNV